MPILVNGEFLPEQLIHAEFERLLFHPDFVGIANELEKRQRVRQAAETGAVNCLLVTQEALKDRRPVDEAAVQAAIVEFRAQMANTRRRTSGCFVSPLRRGCAFTARSKR